MRKIIFIIVFSAGFGIFSNLLSQSWVQSTSPSNNQINVPKNKVMTITFNRGMMNSSFSASGIIVRGTLTGIYNSTFSYSPGTRTLTINHSQNFKIGESVFVTLTSNIKDSSGLNMPSAYNFHFCIKTTGGKGTFLNSGTAYITGMSPYKIISADLDKDNDLDLVVVNNGDNTCNIYHNNGNGNFIMKNTISNLYNANDIAAGDLDNDGNIDLVISCQYSDVLKIFKNSGNGQSFQQYTVPSGGIRPFHICLNNLNSDGLLDIVVTNWESGLVSIFFNTGNMQFVNYTNLNVGTRPRPVNCADIDNDGDYDILVGIDWSPPLIVIILNVNGVFTPNYIYTVYDRPYSIEVNDFNNDGFIDFAVSNIYENKLSVFLNSQGYFNQTLLFALGDRARNLLSADFDHDNDIDLSLSSSNSNIFSIYKNNGSGFYSPHSFINNWGMSFSHAIGDFDNDLDIDIASANQNTNNISIFLNENDVGIKPVSQEVPSEYILSQNYPNPFNSETVFNLSLPENGYINLSLYNIAGQNLGIIHQGYLLKGIYQFRLNATDYNIQSGIVFYRIVTDNYVETKKMTYVK